MAAVETEEAALEIAEPVAVVAAPDPDLDPAPLEAVVAVELALAVELPWVLELDDTAEQERS